VDFFLTKTFIKDINTTNPLGQKGELAEHYFELLKELWSASTSVVEPRTFKKAIEKCDQRFAGYQQHDSQELLIFLLDGIHEDLNRVKSKPYVEKVEGDGKKDEECANAAWAGHKARNDSIIVDYFQGLLKSTLTCPINARVSTTFDPFMYLTVPIPVQSTRKIPVTLHRIEPGKPTKYGITVDKEGTITDLVRELSKLSSIPPDNIAILEVYSYKFYKYFADKDEISDIRDGDKIYAYEIKLTEKKPKSKKVEEVPRADVPDVIGTSDDDVPSSADRVPAAGEESTGDSSDEGDEQIYHLPVLWKKIEGGYSSSYFGVPFILSVRSSITLEELYDNLIRAISFYLSKSQELLLVNQIVRILHLMKDNLEDLNVFLRFQHNKVTISMTIIGEQTIHK
jgi:hypothetical protein